MKIIKNRITQIVIALILITGIGFTINHFTKPVLADNKVDMEVFNNKMKELEEKISNLETELNAKIKSLETENEALKEKIGILETNNNISKLENRVSKIEARENYLYETGENGRLPSLYTISKYINENLK